MNKEVKILAVIVLLFLACFFLPVGHPRFDNAVLEAFHLARSYAREHVLLCLVPAFFIAGAIAVFISQASVMKYLGPQAFKPLAYGVASVSGSILAVCSCTVLPLFAGIYRMGAGLGPATAFLYAGPAINIMAIILTARVLGAQLGIARAVGAVIFSVVIGLLMHLIFRHEEQEKQRMQAEMPEEDEGRPLWKTALYFASMVGILVFANWAPAGTKEGLWHVLHQYKWLITACFAIGLGGMLFLWFQVKWWKMLLTALVMFAAALLFPSYPVIPFTLGVIGLSMTAYTSPGELKDWLDSTWSFSKQIMPLLFIGVFIAGLLLGRPGEEGLIPSAWVARLVGGNALQANLFAAVLGAFMYFATLTEVPIVQGLMGSGMGEGPALALLLAGPALSLPNMLVIRNIMGTKKTVVFVVLVVVMATISGMIFGLIAG